VKMRSQRGVTRQLLTLIAVFILGAPAVSVSADGLSNVPYNYVSPPPFLKTTNLPPRSGASTVDFKNGVSERDLISTLDAQANIDVDPGTFPPLFGQRGVRIAITPLSHYPALPRGSAILDGNVYGFRAWYVPSGKRVTRLNKRALITLEYPHTPSVFIGLKGRHWIPLCNQNTMVTTPATASCYVHSLLPAVTLLYHPLHGRLGAPAVHPSRSGHGLPLVYIVLIAMGVVIIAIALTCALWARHMPFRRT
jgi:hypothetical protein